MGPWSSRKYLPASEIIKFERFLGQSIIWKSGKGECHLLVELFPNYCRIYHRFMRWVLLTLVPELFVLQLIILLVLVLLVLVAVLRFLGLNWNWKYLLNISCNQNANKMLIEFLRKYLMGSQGPFYFKRMEATINYLKLRELNNIQH